jgi:hypothetical protein
MPKPGAAPITAADMDEFVKNNSDFDFEMKVLNWLNANGFTCQHSATYRDPITGKFRQFDIRAEIKSDNHILALAVECKNLRPNNPLLISAAPRTEAEAFHSYILYRSVPVHRFEAAYVLGSGVYRANYPVGKTTDQVSRIANELQSDDEQTFGKISQAINGCKDLVEKFAQVATGLAKRIIVPVLVVPTDTLWQVNYDTNGLVLKPPATVPHSTYFIDSSWSAELPYYREQITYRISHLEIVTFDGLSDALDLWIGPRGFFS